MNITISPKVAVWLNVIYMLLTGITAQQLTSAGVADASQIVAIAALVAMPINILLHGVSSGDTGPIAKAVTWKKPS